MARAIVTMPPTAQRGDLVEIRTLIAHPMESGFRVDAQGGPMARDIITRFECRYNDEPVFAADLSPAIAANPYIAFYVVAADSGTLTFTWEGDNGFAQTATATLTVT